MTLRRSLIALLWIAIGLTAGAGWMEQAVVRTPLASIDQGAQRYYDKALTHALTAYAAARGLNAVISVIQSSEVAVSPAGVGVAVAAGEILDPLNDLIERFSWVVLTAATSLGIQKILITVMGWTGMRILLPLAAMLGILATFWPGLVRGRSLTALKLVWLAVALRFALPLIAVGTGQIDRLFLASQSEVATLELTQAADQADAPDAAHSAPTDSSLVGKVKHFFSSIGQAVKLEERISRLKASVDGLIHNVIDLIVIFALKTLIIPLMMLWLLGKLLEKLINHNPAEGLFQRIKNKKPA